MSILHEAVNGLIVVGGLYGSGKTVLAMTAEDPSLVTMIDMDQKSEARAKALGIKYYTPDFDIAPADVDLEKTLQWFRAALRDLPEDRELLIIDNGSVVEDAFHVAVQQDPERYGVKRANAASGKYGGTNPGVGRLWKDVVTYIKNKGYRTVIVCMHMSAIWAGGAPVDKYKTKGNKTLTELANLSLVLVRSDKPNTPPRGIVGKEALGLVTYKDGEFEVYMALPPVVPECTWKNIAGYIDTAKERTAFTKEERPTKQDLARYSEWLTDAQKDLIRTVASNPAFNMSDNDAEGAVSRGTQNLNSWDEVIKKAIAEKGYDSAEAVREEMKKFYVDGMAFDDAYSNLPTK